MFTQHTQLQQLNALVLVFLALLIWFDLFVQNTSLSDPKDLLALTKEPNCMTVHTTHEFK